MALISWEESDCRWMEFRPWRLQHSRASLIASPSAIKAEETCSTCFFWRSSCDVTDLTVQPRPAFLSSFRQAASVLTTVEAELCGTSTGGALDKSPSLQNPWDQMAAYYL
ncbi:unnamed protein product [Brassica oleracea var. botrytis]